MLVYRICVCVCVHMSKAMFSGLVGMIWRPKTTLIWVCVYVLFGLSTQTDRVHFGLNYFILTMEVACPKHHSIVQYNKITIQLTAPINLIKNIKQNHTQSTWKMSKHWAGVLEMNWNGNGNEYCVGNEWHKTKLPMMAVVVQCIAFIESQKIQRFLI